MDSPTEILIVLVVAMVLFGPTRLPKLARSMGEAMKELKSGFANGASGPTADGPEAVATADAELPDLPELIQGDIESVSDVG